MAYKISWHNPSTMLIEFFGDVSSEDILAMTNESFALVESADHPIDAIVDQAQATSLPSSLNTLIKSIPRHKHQYQGMTILLIPKMNQLGRFAASTLLQVLGLEYRIAQTLEEAEQMIQKRRAHI